MSCDDGFYDLYLAPLESRMLRTVHRVLRDPDAARDALQDALVRIWQRRDVVRRHPRPEALLLRICLHAAVDAVRREARRRETTDVGALEERTGEPGGGPLASLADRERRQAVLAAIARLPHQQALAVLMRIVEEQPYARVAQVLGCSPITARIHVMRARSRLRRLLAPKGPGGTGRGGPL